ncbi:MAG: hypothetical protein NTW61_02155, partial [Candidatus Melainabacteria bacterium]|nr:hypothetical protein [Candidatus Melainabacteria bacterium]
HQKGIDGGMFFLPLRWTERIGSCRANAMVVPTGGFACLRYFNCQLVLEAIPTEYKNDLLKQDDSDGYYFINYLNCKSEMWQQNQGKHYLTFLTRHKKVCEKLLEEGTQEEDENKRKKLKEKGDWLKKYHNDHIYRCIFQLTIRPELEQELEITTLELKNKLLTD